ncbi:hypothetical protein DSM112329_04839 [Paraconexibacter sp. AEG42_29]|uniref:Uncharacterized protein n=1 Tax=Paraconexibacter sp. AEG42_29 TaxID=2997339 RepID=A0AAU7B1R3_9ACTN
MIPARAARALLPVAALAALAAGPATAVAAKKPVPPRQPAQKAQVRLAPLAVSALSFIGSNLASGVISKVGGDAFGAVLSQVGFADPAAQQLAELKAVGVKLDRIEASVDKLHDEVLRTSVSLHNARLNAVRHSASELVGRVMHAVDLLQDLANGKYTDPTLRAEKRQELLNLIETKLKDEQNFLNHVIYSPQGNDDIVHMAYRAERVGNRFFTSDDGRAAGRIFDYYQTANSLLLMLRVEYEYSSVKADSTDGYKAEKRAAVKSLIDKQYTARAPGYAKLPFLLGGDYEIVDTKTGIVWEAPRPGIYLSDQIQDFLNVGHHIPSLAETRKLVSGRTTGQTPTAYLRAQGWTLPTHCDRDNQDYRQNSYPATETVYWTTDRSGTRRYAWAMHDDGAGLLARACVMFVRQPRADHRYYY